MKNHTCIECGGWNGHHFTNCPETPDDEGPETEEADCRCCGMTSECTIHHATVDADTLRKRAFADRRGSVVMAGHLNSAHGALPFSLRWSTAGRTDQLDLFVDRRHVLTAAAPRIVPELLALIA